MGDSVKEIFQDVAENSTETLSGSKLPASPEGAAVAYGSLIIMAMLPIFFGAFRSVKHQKDQKVQNRYKCVFVTKFTLLSLDSRILVKN